MNEITKHHNSILNPDAVINWAFDEDKAFTREKFIRVTSDRASRAAALLPNVERYYPSEYERAKLAALKWGNVAKWYTTD